MHTPVRLTETPYWWVRLCYLEESDPRQLEHLLATGHLQADLDHCAVRAMERVAELLEQGVSRNEAEARALKEIVIPLVPASQTVQEPISLITKKQLDKFKADH